jgi:hypothetical protein
LSRIWKAVIVTFGVILVLVGGVAVFLWTILGSANYTPSDIVEFRPTAFEAKADGNFFFSVGDELKYSNAIDPEAVTLVRGHIDNFLVSPDRRKIAVVSNGTLSIVSSDGAPVRRVAPVDSIYSKQKTIGRSFFRDDGFQWSKDAKYLYVIKDEYYDSRGSQLYSAKGEGQPSNSQLAAMSALRRVARSASSNGTISWSGS